MIPRLPPTHSTRKCATPTIPRPRVHASTGRRTPLSARGTCTAPDARGHRDPRPRRQTPEDQHSRRTRAPAEPARNGQARPIQPHAPRTTTTQTLTPISDVMTYHNLDAEPDRSRRGVRPISARSARSASTIEAQYNTSPPVHAAVTRDDATPPCRWSQISSSSTAGTSLARRTASTSSSGS